jgi:hypothetical protein
MADIFLSYKRADAAPAAQIVALLEAEGWSVWWDTRPSFLLVEIYVIDLRQIFSATEAFTGYNSGRYAAVAHPAAPTPFAEWLLVELSS